MSNHSENINELASALSKAQSEMQAAVKDSENPFFKSKYADLGSVWDACRPVLGKNGLCVMQFTEIVNEKLMMVSMLAHSSGQWIKSYLPLNPAKTDAQGIGSAISYMRRYGLSALIGVVADDADDDGEAAVGRGRLKKQEIIQKPVDVSVVQSNTKITQQHLNDLIDGLKKLDDQYKENFNKVILERYKTINLSELPDVAYQTCMNSINRKLTMVTNG